MAQLETAAGDVPNDTVVATEPTIEDRFAAFGSDEDRDEEEPEGDLPPEGEHETEPEPEDIPDEEVPAIQPPVSWTAEEKAEFADLPRAVQETIAKREAEREKFVQTKATEAKQARQTVEREAVEAIGRMENAHLQTLQAMLPEIPPEPNAFLQAQDPYAYASQMEAHKQAIAQHQYVQQVAQAVNQRLSGLAQEANAMRDREFAEVLGEKFPEYLDESKKPELKREFQSTLRALGYPEGQIDNADAEDILALRVVSQLKAKADKYDTLMAKKMEGVRSAKTLPKVSRPGTPQGRGTIEAQRYGADRQAMRSGDKDAAARVFSRFV